MQRSCCFWATSTTEVAPLQDVKRCRSPPRRSNSCSDICRDRLSPRTVGRAAETEARFSFRWMNRTHLRGVVQPHGTTVSECGCGQKPQQRAAVVEGESVASVAEAGAILIALQSRMCPTHWWSDWKFCSRSTACLRIRPGLRRECRVIFGN